VFESGSLAGGVLSLSIRFRLTERARYECCELCRRMAAIVATFVCSRLSRTALAQEVDGMKRMSLVLGIGMLCVASSLTAFAGLGGKTLVVAHDVNFPPFEYLQDDNYVGFDLDLLQALAEVGRFARAHDCRQTRQQRRSLRARAAVCGQNQYRDVRQQ